MQGLTNSAGNRPPGNIGWWQLESGKMTVTLARNLESLSSGAGRKSDVRDGVLCSSTLHVPHDACVPGRRLSSSPRKITPHHGGMLGYHQN
jgi:hypothetical protein